MLCIFAAAAAEGSSGSKKEAIQIYKNGLLMARDDGMGSNKFPIHIFHA